MKKKAADDFYTKICIWTFLCLILAAACHQIKAFIDSDFRRGSETSAVQSIQTIKILQAQYASKHQGRFAPNFNALIEEGSLIDHFTGQNPVANGYVYTMKVEEPSNYKPPFYSISADPLSTPGADDSELRHFYFDSTLGTTRQTEENRPAKADDPSI